LSAERLVTIVADDHDIAVPAGTSVAAALLNHGIGTFRRSVTGQGRGPLCGMGICYECRVTIDGVPHRRACLVPVREGLQVRTRDEDVA
jgi:sarcosine oxidase subunit alpha